MLEGPTGPYTQESATWEKVGDMWWLPNQTETAYDRQEMCGDVPRYFNSMK